MLEAPLAPYLFWAKTRKPALVDLAGSNLVHCSLGDLPGAREALDITAPNDNGYAPVVEAIAAHYGVDRARIVTATGCSGANFIAMGALVGAGDEVLVERPAYDPLIGAAKLMGATITRFDRRFDEGFAIDPDAVRRQLSPRTRMIVVTSPHNPSGVMASRDSLAALTEIAASRGIHVLVDEVYLDGASFVSGTPLAARTAALLEGPVVVTSSLTKSYGLAGLKSGWAIAPPHIAERMRRARDVIDNASSAPADRLAALAWSQQADLADRAGRLLRQNMVLARDFFAAHPQFVLAEPPACSVTFPRLAGLSDSASFVQSLLDRYGVAVAPGRFFESPAHFRVSLAGRTDLLEAGLSALGKNAPAIPV